MTPKPQRGAVLFVALMLLLILTVIGVDSMNDTIMQGSMVGAIQDGNTALQGGETAIRQAEDFLDGIANIAGFGAAPGLYLAGAGGDPYLDATWTAVNSITANGIAGLAEQPRYYIELAGAVTNNSSSISINQSTYSHESGTVTTLAFRIIAYSTGSSGTARRVVESYYARVF